jgi:predicted nucleotide-binding protein
MPPKKRRSAAKRAGKSAKSPARRVAPEPAKKSYFSQSDFPQSTVQNSQKIAVGIWENFAGKGASPPDVALAIGMSPTSSTWRALCGSSIAYGLSTGGHNADQITLTPLGRRLVAPEAEGDDLKARAESVLKPRILKEFFERYRRAKFPNDTIGANVLVGMGVPADRAANALDIVKANGRYAGIIRDTPTGPFVNLDSLAVPAPVASEPGEDDDSEETNAGARTASAGERAQSSAPPSPINAPASAGAPAANRVFITHGKQRAIVNQIKELLTFGQLEPVVSVERETTAIPVPEKVFEDMRSCSAGVIHVNAEAELLDSAGNRHIRINENVLIEIGAAIALFGKRVILLVEKGVQLPSNLQGLYRCEYEGDRLEYDATMKLLKTFNQFRG